MDTNTLRTNYPGLGSIIQWKDVKDGFTVNNNTLRYNAMQLNVQRRLHQGLQMGLAYTLAKGVGWNGYNQDYLDADPTGALNRLRLWGPTANDRTHNLTLNYSYAMPKLAPGVPVVNALLRDWMVSGVTKYLSGAATQPTCTTNTAGVANRIRRSRRARRPPASTPASRCSTSAGSQPARRGSAPLQPGRLRDGHAAQRHGRQLWRRAARNPPPPGILELGHDPRSAAFRSSGRGRQVQARLQLQLYNIFNTPQFTTLNTALAYQDDPNIPGPDSLLLTNTTAARYMTYRQHRPVVPAQTPRVSSA